MLTPRLGCFCDNVGYLIFGSYFEPLRESEIICYE